MIYVTQATKTMVVWETSETLIIHFKRFDQGPSSRFHTKYKDVVHFPKEVS